MPGQLVIGDVFRSAARAAPTRVAAALGDATLTFAELDRAANRTARALSRLGVGHADRVATWAGTTLASPPVFAALAKLGAVFVPLNGAFTPDEVRAVLAVATPDLVLVDAGPDVTLPAPTMTFDALEGLADAEDDDDVSAEVSELDTHVVFFTSGSSGQPKGAVLSHRANCLRSLPGALLEPRGAMVCPFPLFHMGAWTIALQQWQARDAVVFVPAARSELICAAVARHRATRINAVPAVWRRILDLVEGGTAGDLSSLRFADTGTSATPPELLSAIGAALPDAQVRVFYGSTEAGGVTILDHRDIAARPGSCGVPGPLCAVKLTPDGELCVTGPLLFDGYLHDPDATAAALVDGWYHSGDLAEVDGDGYLSIVGRAGEVIRTGGESVTPSEVEVALAGHPAVADLAVVGTPDPDYGEVVCVAVVVAQGCDAPALDELRALCAGRLAAFKQPRRLEIVDAIPRTASTGQVQRRLLAERLG